VEAKGSAILFWPWLSNAFQGLNYGNNAIIDNNVNFDNIVKNYIQGIHRDSIQFG
jgi:hypothetical protein